MRPTALALLLTLGLAGCGGSGSGGPSSVSYPTAGDYAELRVSNDNASSLYSGTTTALADDTTSTPGVSSDAFTHRPATALNALSQVTELYPTFTTRALQRVSTRQTSACAGGGSMTVTGTGQLTAAGDTLSVTFANCVTAGSTVNGGFSMTNVSSGSSAGAIRLVFDNLLTVDATQSVYVDGDLSTEVSSTGSTTVVTMTSTRLNVKDSLAGDTVMSNLLIRGELDTGGASRLSMAYTLASDAINGRITVSTPIQLAFDANQTYPSTGQLRITGEGGSYVEFDANTGDVSTVLVTVSSTSGTTANTVSWTSLGGQTLTGVVDFT
ncbi:MAG: hypothetical protein AAGA11_12525 [Pseudomonadota bacterium]